MRWKVICLNEIERSSRKIEWYDINSLCNPNQVKELLLFENELIALVRKIELKKKTKIKLKQFLEEDTR